MLYGLDASNWQGQVNWRAVRQGGYYFGAELATDGLTFENPIFPQQWAMIWRSMPVRFAYHFLRIDLDGKAQADYFHKYVRDSGGMRNDCAVLLDCEDYGSGSRDNAYNAIVEFTERALETIERQVCIYIGRYYLQWLGRDLPKVITDRPLWLPSWQSSPPQPLPPWKNISFWQDQVIHNVPGVVGDIDHDVFFGNKEQLHKVVARP